MTLADLIPLAIMASLVGMVFCLGMKATMDEVLYLVRRPGFLIRSLVSMYVVMPVFAIAVALLFPVALEVKAALVALAVSPVPPILPAKQTRAGGSASYADSLLVVAAFATLLVVPVAMAVLGAISQNSYSAPMARIASLVAITVIAPLFAGLIVRHFSPAFADRFAQPISRLSTILLLVAVVPVIFTSWAAFQSLIHQGVIVFLILFALVGFATGHALGGPDAADRVVLALATGTRHPGVAIAIVSLNLPDHRAIQAVILWHLIIAAIVAIPYLRGRKVAI